MPPLLGPEAPRVLPRADPLDTNLAAGGPRASLCCRPCTGGHSYVTCNALRSILGTFCPPLGEQGSLAAPPVARGIPARSKNSLPLFPKKVAPPIVPPKRPSSPDRIPPLLVANGMIGIGKIGIPNFWALGDHALRSVSIFGNRPLDLFIDLRDAKILLNV